jgi:MarR family transcriptional regulator, organic hydroperoxide resistance regulator
MPRSKIIGKNEGHPGKAGDISSDVNIASLLFSQAFVNWHKAFMKALDPYEITYSQWIILRTLMLSGTAMSPSELNKYLTIEGTSISLVIDGIEKRGLIQRRRSRVDRRMVKVKLMEAGKKLVGEIDGKVGQLIQDIFGSLTVAERRQLIHICRKIRDATILHNGGNPDFVEAILLKFSGFGHDDTK